jgi:hypothetical protein
MEPCENKCQQEQLPILLIRTTAPLWNLRTARSGASFSLSLAHFAELERLRVGDRVQSLRANYRETGKPNVWSYFVGYGSTSRFTPARLVSRYVRNVS